MVTVTKMEDVLASLALMKTSVEYVPRDFMDFHAAKVFIKFQFFQKINYFLFIVYFMSFIECNCDQDGSKSDNCDDVGKCSCKLGFEEDKCDTCAQGFFGFPYCQGIYIFSIFSKNNVIFSLLSTLCLLQSH